MAPRLSSQKHESTKKKARDMQSVFYKKNKNKAETKDNERAKITPIENDKGRHPSDIIVEIYDESHTLV